jgi:hypothetical protein
MCDNKGNHWEETSYGGYCSFGGVDYFVVLAHMNGVIDTNQLQDEYAVEEARCKGIDMYYKKEEDTLYPNLVESENFFLGWQWVNERPESCPDQGYFYSEECENIFN